MSSKSRDRAAMLRRPFDRASMIPHEEAERERQRREAMETRLSAARQLKEKAALPDFPYKFRVPDADGIELFHTVGRPVNPGDLET